MRRRLQVGFSCQPHDEGDERRVEGRPSQPTRPASPIPSETTAMPGDHRRRVHNRQHLGPPRPCPGQQNPKRPIEWLKGGDGAAAAGEARPGTMTRRGTTALVSQPHRPPRHEVMMKIVALKLRPGASSRSTPAPRASARCRDPIRWSRRGSTTCPASSCAPREASRQSRWRSWAIASQRSTSPTRTSSSTSPEVGAKEARMLKRKQRRLGTGNGRRGAMKRTFALILAALAAAALFGGLVHAVLVAAHLSAPAATTVYGLTSRRLWATTVVVLALASVVIGGLALARPTSRFGTASGRLGAIVALVAGLIAVVNGGLVLATAKGGPGTGNGVVCGAGAFVLGLVALALGGLALARARRTGSTEVLQ